MLTKTLTTAAVATAMLLAAVPAWAHFCILSRLADAYQVYVHETSIGWTRCIIEVDVNGGVEPGTRCKSSDGTRAVVDGGSLSISRKCGVKGHIDIMDASGVLRYYIDHSRLSRDRHIVGVGHTEIGTTFVLSAVSATTIY